MLKRMPSGKKLKVHTLLKKDAKWLKVKKYTHLLKLQELQNSVSFVEIDPSRSFAFGKFCGCSLSLHGERFTKCFYVMQS